MANIPTPERGPVHTEVVEDLATLRERIHGWKRSDLRIGFVPTMGNLHAGHASLVRLARAHCDRVVASSFVNPTQFGAGEDFGRYPRTPQADIELLAGSGCDLLWRPSVDSMYPHGTDAAVQLRVPALTDVLEGAHRPGHFDGVASVVARLFNQVQPDVAVFGRKDYQQLAVIRRLVRDLSFPVEIVAGETIREADGLAMSSRNQYLSPQERSRAADIHRVLLRMRDAAIGGQPHSRIEADANEALAAAGFKVDYAVLRTPELQTPATSGALVALVAARLGRTRLIDNLEFVIPD